MRYFSPIVLLGFLILAPFSALAWQHTGHEIIGAIADRLLTPTAKAKLRQVAGISLQSASKWADCVKAVSVEDGKFTYTPDPKNRGPCIALESDGGKQRMEDYVARNWDSCDRGANTEPCHKQYHYSDVAIQHDRYDRSFVGTSDHDIVSAINAAIAVLQGKPAPAPFGIRNQREALLMLAHFVGDIHQPLHVGAIYLDSNNIPANPDGPGQQLDRDTETRGGNSIAVGATNLHAMWDVILTSVEPAQIGIAMVKEAKAVGPTSGAITTWPVAWASETMVPARGAFRGITFQHDPETKNYRAAVFKHHGAYLIDKNRMQRGQLAKAGARLAQVLNEVWR
jgi:hypothetical protein